MVADMADFSKSWKELCGRLGVQPKQFATLLTVMVVAVGGLCVRAFAGGPRKASANASVTSRGVPKSAPGSAGKPGAGSAAQMNSSVTKSAIKPSVRRVVECVLDRQPARDPFEVWGLPKSLVPEQVPVARVTGDAQPGYLPGVLLKAVVPGELAVFGDQTVRHGDAVALPDGTFARVTAIRSRTVTVDWNGRPLDVNFGAAPQPKNPAPGGFR